MERLNGYRHAMNFDEKGRRKMRINWFKHIRMCCYGCIASSKRYLPHPWIAALTR